MDLPVSEEQPVELMVNGLHVATFMCTPAHLKELALGYLWGVGAIESLDEIAFIGACTEMHTVNVRLNGCVPETIELGKFLASGCGSGGYVQEDWQDYQVNSDFSISAGALRRGFGQMYRNADRYQKTGGIHSAAIIDSNTVIDLKEDVGRHNAVDKVMGSCLLNGHDPADVALVTTGRLSSDMILKALGAGFPLVATRSIPTSLALEIAQKASLTLVGRAHRKKPLIYCGAFRVANGNPGTDC